MKPLKNNAKQIRLKAFLLFTLHQLLSTFGVIILSGVLCFGSVAILHIYKPALTSKQASWLLTEVPGFPVQILVGTLFGFILAKVAQTKSVLLVWVAPLLLLTFGALVVVNPGSSTFVHFLGNGCKPSDHCFDQILFTLPFAASTAYALGAIFARSRFEA